MKISLKIQQLCLMVVLLIFFSCKDSFNPKPVKIGEVPAPITKFSVKSIPGGAIITYNLPEGDDVRYVKATYTINNGTTREAKSTVYKNTLLVDGFSAAGEYEISLTVVGVGEKESTPTNIKIIALKPVHQFIIDEIENENKMYATFGGINIDYQNDTESNLVIRVMTKNAQGNWQVAETAYTKAKSGRIKLRGYQPVEREFSVFITDRWNNKSDTLIRSLSPIFEKQFEKRLFKQYNLPGDTYTPHTGASRARDMPVLWDGLNNRNGSIFHTRPVDVMPQHFTWDMGVKAKLSRFIFYPDVNADNTTVFGAGQPSVWELWGSNNPNPDGTFGSWTQVGTYRSVKPSGLPLGQISSADIEQCLKGEEFEVDPNVQGYRYWRWRSIANWGNLSYIYMSEFSFFGIEQ
ncbi:DUF5000 domain-containing lipoprotein [Pedobacter sp. PLR]|uniref:DUF5000 domain-containing lipoprotein n=1 Tax=Pedobacter sp. PLR TaxID=2994465 RepID=UPI002247FF3A|nr:DUF5000 domain-containing lipoprotein [Pedobacter sp. PLR]MCX2452253.1 DUF5000 domain-containing lipoprotein [Pedobacter sp. PLR]